MSDEKRTIIDSFKNEFGFLSNFYEASVYIDGKRYRTVEHAYQAMKSDDPTVRELIRNAKTPYDAKKLGKSVQLPSDWDTKKFGIMRELIRQKFDNPFLAPLLLATDDAELVEGNWWGDRVWGVCKGAGENHLGKILMEARSDLRKKARDDNSP